MFNSHEGKDLAGSYKLYYYSYNNFSMMKHSVSPRLSSAMVRVAAPRALIQGLGAKCICHPFLGLV